MEPLVVFKRMSRNGFVSFSQVKWIAWSNNILCSKQHNIINIMQNWTFCGHVANILFSTCSITRLVTTTDTGESIADLLIEMKIKAGGI